MTTFLFAILGGVLGGFVLEAIGLISSKQRQSASSEDPQS